MSDGKPNINKYAFNVMYKGSACINCNNEIYYKIGDITFKCAKCGEEQKLHKVICLR